MTNKILSTVGIVLMLISSWAEWPYWSTLMFGGIVIALLFIPTNRT